MCNKLYWCHLKTISSCTLVPDKVILVDPWWSPANEIDHHQLDLHCIEPVDPGLNLVIPSFKRSRSYVIYLQLNKHFLAHKGYWLTLFILLRAIFDFEVSFLCFVVYKLFSKKPSKCWRVSFSTFFGCVWAWMNFLVEISIV